METETNLDKISAQTEPIQRESNEHESTENQKKPFSVIIVLGGGFETKQKNISLKLTMESRMRALAVLEMYKSGMADKILLSGGKTAGGDQLSEAMAMRNFIKEQESKYLQEDEAEIPDEVFVLDEEPRETSESLERIEEILQDVYPNTDSREAVILSSTTHLPRVKKLLGSYGVEVKDTVGAESRLTNLVDRHGHNYFKRFIERYARSLRVKKAQATEVIMRTILIVDSKALTLRWLANRVRHGEESESSQANK